jgi:hypothetical protein
MEVRKQFQIEISNRFEALENLNDSEDITIRENIKVSAKETLGLYGQKQHKPWFNEDVHRFYVKRSRLKCSGYIIKTSLT